MKDKWDKLTSVFLKILSLYQELLELGNEKRTTLVQHNVDKLEEIVKKEENVILQVGKFDRMRRSLVKEIAHMYGLVEKEPTLGQISRMADQDMRHDIKKIEDDLKNVVLDISQVNKVNQQLVDQGLLIVNYSLNLLAQNTVGPTYHPNENTTSASHNKSLFDSKV